MERTDPEHHTLQKGGFEICLKVPKHHDEIPYRREEPHKQRIPPETTVVERAKGAGRSLRHRLGARRSRDKSCTTRLRRLTRRLIARLIWYGVRGCDCLNGKGVRNVRYFEPLVVELKISNQWYLVITDFSVHRWICVSKLVRSPLKITQERWKSLDYSKSNQRLRNPPP